MKRFTLFILTYFFVIGVYSQSKNEIKANKKFYEFSLQESILLFEEIEQSELSTNSLRNYADAHRYLHQTEKAEILYAALVNRNNSKPEDLFMYAEMLLMNKKQREWKVWMDKFHDRLVTDGRGQDFIAKKGEFAQIRDDEGLFKMVKILDINSAQEDFGASYYQDKVVFTSSRNSQRMAIKRIWNWTKFPYLNLYEASVGDSLELENLTLISKKVNKKYHEGPASYSKDGNFMVFTRNNYEEKSSDDRVKLKMFYRVKNEKGEWSKLKGFDFNNKEYSVGHPSVTPDGKTIYFASDMPGGYGSIDIYKTVKLNDGSWSAPINLGDKINTEGREMFPFIHNDGFILFASDGHVGLGGLDIFKSRIKDEAFGNPKNLGYPANDSKDDFAMIINDEQTSGYFSSNRPGKYGSDDIYAFVLNKELVPECLAFKGVTKDNEGNILAFTELTLVDQDNKTLKELKSSDLGEYDFCLDEGNYRLIGKKEEYKSGETLISLTKDETSTVVVLELIKDEFILSGVVTDNKSGEPIANATLVLLNNKTGEKVMIQTDENGVFEYALNNELNEEISYSIELSKEGYFTKDITFDKTLSSTGKILVPSDSLAMDREVDTIEEMVVINDIKFDFDKSNIRPDAAVELDKIVEVMNRYPKMVVELGSHTDCRGSKWYNEKLSDRRAKSSANYIKTRISNPNRIYGKGYGESKLLNDCACEPTNKSSCSEDQHQKNRRTEFRIIKSKNAKVINNSHDSF